MKWISAIIIAILINTLGWVFWNHLAPIFEIPKLSWINFLILCTLIKVFTFDADNWRK